jgi:hypothetical protein
MSHDGTFIDAGMAAITDGIDVPTVSPAVQGMSGTRGLSGVSLELALGLALW